MAVPKYHEFMKPLLERLADGREHKLRDLYAAPANDFRLTDADRAEYLPSGLIMASPRLRPHQRDHNHKTLVRETGLLCDWGHMRRNEYV